MHSPEASQLFDFLASLLRYDPADRLSAHEALCHPFLAPIFPFGAIIRGGSQARWPYDRAKSAESTVTQPALSSEVNLHFTVSEAAVDAFTTDRPAKLPTCNSTFDIDIDGPRGLRHERQEAHWDMLTGQAHWGLGGGRKRTLSLLESDHVQSCG